MLTFPAKFWKCRSREVIRAENIFHFLSILLLKKDQTAHFFHSLMMSGLKWNFCLFEQEGTGINYKVFSPLFIYSFSVPPGANTGLDAFNVYLTCSSPTPHWIHSLRTPCYHRLEAFFFPTWSHPSLTWMNALPFLYLLWILLPHFWMSDGSAVSICSPQMSRESPSLTLTIRSVVSKLMTTLFYSRGNMIPS